MSFVSLNYLLFFPIISLIYFLLPHKLRWFLLLVGSYFFYMCWNVKFAILMLISTVITFVCSYLIHKAEKKLSLTPIRRKKRKKTFLILSLVSNLGILIFFKYFNFINSSLVMLFDSMHYQWGFDNLNILLPVGISFYTFQALSYSFDVYYKKIKPTTHFGKYALYVSFFPQLVAGPIERSWHLLPQFDLKHKFDYDRIKSGLALILWGVFKKVVIASRLEVVVNNVFGNVYKYSGVEVIIAIIFFAFQIYTDFSAYTDIARGSARVLGIDLMKNFKRPYFATSIPEFWKRWHISLTTWFRDYLYIPLGGNRVSKVKWYSNIMVVFLVSGLWHGAAWTFVFWGFLHGIFQLIDISTKKYRYQFNDLLKINAKSTDVKFFKGIWTFLLVCVAWVFFRAESFDHSILMLKKAMIYNPWKIFDGSLYGLGLDSVDFIFSIILIIFLLASWSLDKKYDIQKIIFNQHLLTRYAVYSIFIFFILLFGFYGPEYDSSEFIYFQF